MKYWADNAAEDGAVKIKFSAVRFDRARSQHGHLHYSWRFFAGDRWPDTLLNNLRTLVLLSPVEEREAYSY